MFSFERVPSALALSFVKLNGCISRQTPYNLRMSSMTLCVASLNRIRFELLLVLPIRATIAMISLQNRHDASTRGTLVILEPTKTNKQYCNFHFVYFKTRINPRKTVQSSLQVELHSKQVKCFAML